MFRNVLRLVKDQNTDLKNTQHKDKYAKAPVCSNICMQFVI